MDFFGGERRNCELAEFLAVMSMIGYRGISSQEQFCRMAKLARRKSAAVKKLDMLASDTVVPGTAIPDQPVVPTTQPNMSQDAFIRIRDAIVNGRLDFGEPLSEASLADALGMSKAPIRTALIDLQSLRLVRIVPKTGTYVASPSRDEVVELCDHRLLLERQALLTGLAREPREMARELAVISDQMRVALSNSDAALMKMLDAEYHACFFRYAGNRYLSDAYDAIRYLIEALRFRFMDTALYRSRAHEEHDLLISAISAEDPVRISKIIEVHIARTKEYQSDVNWSRERLTRKDYKSRDYADVFHRPETSAQLLSSHEAKHVAVGSRKRS